MEAKIAQLVFQQALDIWINPEIEKRKKYGSISEDFELKAAQIIFSVQRGFAKVRLNDEVKAILNVKVTKNHREISKGETVFDSDIEQIESVKLTESDPNSAHITLVKFKGSWIIAFDFNYNKEKVRQHIEAAKEFISSAELCLEKGVLRPFFENAFASAELMAKALLLSVPDKNVLYGKKHDKLKSKFDGWAKLGNVSDEYSTILGRLTSLRPSARYVQSNDYLQQNPVEIIEKLKEMLNHVEGLK